MMSLTVTLPYLEGLKFAQPVTANGKLDIGILVGADHYWDFIEGTFICGDGPTMAKSMVAYLLSGLVNTSFTPTCLMEGQTTSTPLLLTSDTHTTPTKL